MTRHGEQAAHDAGREALITYYRNVAPRVRQDRKFWFRRIVGGFALIGVLCAAGNTVAGGEDRDTGNSSDRVYSAGDSEGQMDSGEATVADQPSDAPEASPTGTGLKCSLSSIIPIGTQGSGTRKFVLDLRSNIDTRDPEATILLPAARDGAIVPGGGGSVVLNSDGSRVAEIPGNSSATDVYAVFLSAAGVEAPCGAFFVDGPQDSSPTILSDQDHRVPDHS